MGQVVITPILPDNPASVAKPHNCQAEQRELASPRGARVKRSGSSFSSGAPPSRERGSFLGVRRALSGLGCHAARGPRCRGAAGEHGVPPASARQRRERYLRRLGITRCSAAGRGGQAPAMPQALPEIDAKGLEIVFERSVSSGSTVQNEESMVDSSNANEDELGVSASVSKSDVVMDGKSDEDHARMKFLQRLSYERVWVPKAQRPPSHQTVIIFDWDDTLLCTSFLNWRQQIGAPLSESVLQQLKAIERADAKLLKMAQCMGQTFIITNAVSGWVQSSAEAWAPSLVPLLEKVQVISARSRYEAEYPHDRWKWKGEMFLEVRRRLNSQVVTNLVSLGDSEYEMEATRAMGREFQRASIKLVKFAEQPHPDELLKQLEVVSERFERIVGEARSQRVKMQRPPRE